MRIGRRWDSAPEWRRTERFNEQLDMLQHLHQQMRRRTARGDWEACHHREAAADSISGTDSIGEQSGRGIAERFELL
jgi:hypothetical protein